jgi:hypothetical protein
LCWRRVREREEGGRREGGKEGKGEGREEEGKDGRDGVSCHWNTFRASGCNRMYR